MENIAIQSKDISVLGANRETTIIDGNDATISFGIYNASSSTVDNFTIQNGTASGGAGINIRSSSDVTLTNIIVTDNESQGDGGAIQIYQSTVTLNGCTISDNHSNAEGGGILGRSASTISILNSDISNNTSNNQGAAIYMDGGTVSLKNVLINGNRSSNTSNGVFRLQNCDATIDNMTMVNNVNSYQPGSIMNLYSGSSAVIRNSIITNNQPNKIIFSELDDSNSLSAYYSNIEDGQDSIVTNNNGTVTWGTGNIDVNPMFVDTANGNYHLLASSMLINAGHPDSTDSDGTRADIGSHPYLNS